MPATVPPKRAGSPAARGRERIGPRWAPGSPGGGRAPPSPATPAEPAPAPPGLVRALGAEARHVGKSAFDYLVEVDAEATLRGLRPDLAALAALPVRGVIVTSRAAGGGFDFVSRFFAPGAGIPEDPVTGSSHCALGPYWGARLGKTELTAYQASARGGGVRVRPARERGRLGGPGGH